MIDGAVRVEHEELDFLLGGVEPEARQVQKAPAVQEYDASDGPVLLQCLQLFHQLLV